MIHTPCFSLAFLGSSKNPHRESQFPTCCRGVFFEASATLARLLCMDLSFVFSSDLEKLGESWT